METAQNISLLESFLHMGNYKVFFWFFIDYILLRDTHYSNFAIQIIFLKRSNIPLLENETVL